MTIIHATSKNSRTVKIGLENADFTIDPYMPLDSEISRLDLASKFDKVRADFVLSKIHGDCSLTHAVLGLKDLLVDEGELTIIDLSTHDIAKDAIRFFETGKPVSGQVREKLLFPEPVENCGILFQQNLMSINRLRPFFPNLMVIRQPNLNIHVEIPDQVDLGGGDVSYENIKEVFTQNRPTCVLCDRPSTKQDHDRSLYSRYCKDHYHQARLICDKGLHDAYLFEVKIKILKEEEVPEGGYCQKECEARAHHTGISMGVDSGEKCVFLEDPFGGKTAQEIMAILDQNFMPSMVIYGDPYSAKADVYDLVLKFAEDRFKTMRHDKDWFGYFVVATNPIE